MRTAVHVQHLPGYLTSFSQVNDRIRYILDRRSSPHRRLLLNNLFRKVGVKRGVNDAWSYGVESNVLLRIFGSETPDVQRLIRLS